MADLVVRIIGDDSSLQKTLRNSTTSMQKFDRTQRRGVSSSRAGSPLGELLTNTRRDIQRAEDLQSREEALVKNQEKIKERFARAAAIGGGFFALGRTVGGAGAALQAFQGHASESSLALEDAGKAIESLITLNPVGFFDAVGGSAKRTAANFDAYAQSLTDANNAGKAVEAAAAARALGFEKQADAIIAKVDALKVAAATARALEFNARTQNVTLVNGKTALVNFRGAGAAEDLRGGLRGAGGIAIDQASRGITVNTTVELDGKEVGRSTTKEQQKRQVRNGRQKRGPNSAFR